MCMRILIKLSNHKCQLIEIFMLWKYILHFLEIYVNAGLRNNWNQIRMANRTAYLFARINAAKLLGIVSFRNTAVVRSVPTSLGEAHNPKTKNVIKVWTKILINPLAILHSHVPVMRPTWLCPLRQHHQPKKSVKPCERTSTGLVSTKNLWKFRARNTKSAKGIWLTWWVKIQKHLHKRMLM